MGSLYGPPKDPTVRRNQPERAFQHSVVQHATYLHVSSWYVTDSRTVPPGWPDLTLYGQGGLIYRELKTEIGRLSVAQKATHADLSAAGQDVAVWRPSDMASGRITRELTVLRRPCPRLQSEDIDLVMDWLNTYSQGSARDRQEFLRIKDGLSRVLGGPR
jgi:hypothetical protein